MDNSRIKWISGVLDTASYICSDEITAEHRKKLDGLLEQIQALIMKAERYSVQLHKVSNRPTPGGIQDLANREFQHQNAMLKGSNSSGSHLQDPNHLRTSHEDALHKAYGLAHDLDAIVKELRTGQGSATGSAATKTQEGKQNKGA